MLALCDVVWCGDGGKGVGFPEYKAYFSSPWGGAKGRLNFKKSFFNHSLIFCNKVFLYRGENLILLIPLKVLLIPLE